MKSLKVKDKEYKLRLTTRRVAEIEKELGTNPLNVFAEAGNGKVPEVNKIMIILHGCMVELNNGISLDMTYEIFDDFLQTGGNIVKIIEILVSVFEDSGFIPNERKN